MIDSGSFNSFDLTGKECCKWEKIVLNLNILENLIYFWQLNTNRIQTVK